jgi:hypothetical protein
MNTTHARLRTLLFPIALTISTACSSDAEPGTGGIVISDDGAATLVVPDWALPEGISLDDISITRIDDSPFPHYDLQPDGLVFDDAVTLTIDLPGADGTIPQLIHISDGVAEVPDVSVVIDPEANETQVSAEISHFSQIAVGTVNERFFDDTFVVTLDRPANGFVHGPVQYTGRIQRQAFDRTGLPATVTVSGELLAGTANLTPHSLRDKPSSTSLIGNSTYSLSGSDVTCTAAGTAHLQLWTEFEVTYWAVRRLGPWPWSEWEGEQQATATVRAQVKSRNFECTALNYQYSRTCDGDWGRGHDANGRVRVWWTDVDQDGEWDSVFVDQDGDQDFDLRKWDTDRDGSFDEQWEDLDDNDLFSDSEQTEIDEPIDGPVMPRQIADACIEETEFVPEPEPETAGACVNESDLDALAESWEQAALCGSIEIVESGESAACLAETAGLSFACASCIEDLWICSWGHCAEACAEGETESCNLCVAEAGCLDPFTTCSGLEK